MRLLFLVVTLALSLSVHGQIFPFGRDARWQTVGAGALAARPATCTANRDVYLCTGAGCTANERIHYCTALNTWETQAGSTPASVTSQGTWAARPATCTVGQIYYVTDSHYKTLRCSAADTWSVFDGLGSGPTEAPPSAGWTTVNPGTATISLTNGTLDMYSLGANPQVLHLRSTPAAPWTLTVKARFTSMPSAAGYVGGLAIRGATDKRYYYFTGGGAYYIQKYNGNVISATVFGPMTTTGVDPVFLQIADDNVNLNFRYSTNGQQWSTIYTEARAAWEVPTQAGGLISTSADNLGSWLHLISWIFS